MFSLPDLTGKNIMMADDSELNRTVLLYLLGGYKGKYFSWRKMVTKPSDCLWNQRQIFLI